MALFDRFPVTLISVDSAQVYRGLDIGSAKLEPSLLERYPHELINLRWPEQSYSAAEFVADAEAVMRSAQAAGRIPVLVGGTVLYARALMYGLDPLPAADSAVRARIAEQAASKGWEALHAELAARDPETAARIRASDPQRVQRALEILELTGKGMTALHSGPRMPRFPTLRLVLTPRDRQVLHERIAQRLDAMLDAGFIDEVRRLRQRPGLSADHTAMRSVGYRQVWEYLEGSCTRAALRERAVAATRQLAKRQLTGLRRLPGTLWYDSQCRRRINDVCRQAGRFCERIGR